MDSGQFTAISVLITVRTIIKIKFVSFSIRDIIEEKEKCITWRIRMYLSFKF